MKNFFRFLFFAKMKLDLDLNAEKKFRLPSKFPETETKSVLSTMLLDRRRIKGGGF